MKGVFYRTASSGSEQRLDPRLARARLPPQVRRGALGRILVRPEAQELRPVPEAVALHLVVAHLDDELRPDRGLLELARAPAVRLGEVLPLGGVAEQRQHPLRDLIV